MNIFEFSGTNRLDDRIMPVENFAVKSPIIMDFVVPFNNTLQNNFELPIFTNTAVKSILINGVVKDAYGAIPNASLSYVDPISNLTKGITTDFNGNFSSNVPANVDIIISYVGYDRQIYNSNNIPKTIVLSNDKAGLLPEISMNFQTDKAQESNTNNLVKYGAIGIGVLALGYFILSKKKGLKGVAHVTI